MSADSPSQDAAARDVLAAVLGRVPSGVFVLTVADGEGRRTGMLASWVQQAAFAPPVVSVAVNRSRYFLPWLERNPHVALSLVGVGQTKFLKHFGAGFGPDEPAFEGIAVHEGPSGAMLLDEALGILEGRVVQQVPVGDHVVCFVEIDRAEAGAGLESGSPMVHVRKNGFRY
jgi:flavin reductase (DIM6/NTAB) family NADH-FMN oxidoreductase RutF